MEIDVIWNDTEYGYEVFYNCPSMGIIDPAEGNGSEDDFYFDIVEPDLLEKLSCMGITSEALVSGTGSY
ncbi:MAG: hypothetical protein J5449_11025 [Oscillospiraceae bacterium]|nr:hypothetical protein [Oscillospiraceae bacterium]